jgi:hypothetical protein
VSDNPARDDTAQVTGILHQGLDLVEDLSRKLQHLDELMLAGQPAEIADAAASVEAALKAASPAFSEIAATMERLGAASLQAASLQFRQSEQDAAAAVADALRDALARFARRSVAANRRAQHLNRGLNATLKTLHALGAHDTGRLIAEA